MTIDRIARTWAIPALAALAACAPGSENRAEPAADQAVPAANAGFAGVTVNPPMPKPDFVLGDTEGEPYDFRAETEGKVALLFFGYTNCPDACPVQLSMLGTVLRRFPYEVRSRVQVVFVTTDPERDTPDRLREWLDNFDPNFVGLRGDTAEVARIQRTLGMSASTRQPAPDGDGYFVGHWTAVVAFTTDNLGHVNYPMGVRQETWERDIPRLVEYPSAPDS